MHCVSGSPFKAGHAGLAVVSAFYAIAISDDG